MVLLLVLLAALPAVQGDYGYDAPPASEAVRIFQPEIWLDRVKHDLLPYWLLPHAVGDPLGNYPTFRARDGRAIVGGESGIHA